MVFLVNRANLDRRTLYRRIHDSLASRTNKPDSPVESVRYYPSRANMEEVRARIDAPKFVGDAYPVEDAEIHVYFDFPRGSTDRYRTQWVETERELMVGWHQDETHPELGECHFQTDFEGETVYRKEAEHLDDHPMNIFDERVNAFPDILSSLSWESGTPEVPRDLL